ncbi:response regulator transcription factor [Paenibacillus beijingensis]|uniref:AraC family transcriptional regulator n=1 Tax=Paenibacillus beijingensis TaxID=1126833 RepID=A0A0D5NLJ5_9BACL|nr:response regulator [Paenibacillus beijingensis]AJY75798.1 AraC family transcriptional regulator [Paenibacillus beijingensis]
MFRILVVDDEPMIRTGLVKLLQAADGSISAAETAANGEEAMELMRRCRPDFLITDIKMPRMDGLELCRQARELYKDLPIVVISGYGEFEYARQCMSCGVKQYLLKPVTRDGVRETVKKLIAEANERYQPAYFSIAKLEQWLDLLEQAVWHLEQKTIGETIAEMESYCRTQCLDGVQTRQLLTDVYANLLKKLNKRDVYKVEAQDPLPLAAGLKEQAEIYAWFGQSLQGLVNWIKGKRKGNLKEPIEEAKDYIERNLSRELSLDEVADMVGLNPSYFSQLFKQMTDETFVHYRIKRRMEKAKKLLAVPHYKITDISFEVGYADHPHFTKTFKRMTGCTPSEYREKLGID